MSFVLFIAMSYSILTKSTMIIKRSTSLFSPVLIFHSLFRIFFVMAQNTTIPVDVGMILDYDSLFGKMGLSCINMALSDFYASHAYYKTRLVLHTRDSMRDVVVEAAAGSLSLLPSNHFLWHIILKQSVSCFNE